VAKTEWMTVFSLPSPRSCKPQSPDRSPLGWRCCAAPDGSQFAANNVRSRPSYVARLRALNAPAPFKKSFSSTLLLAECDQVCVAQVLVFTISEHPARGQCDPVGARRPGADIRREKVAASPRGPGSHHLVLQGTCPCRRTRVVNLEFQRFLHSKGFLI